MRLQSVEVMRGPAKAPTKKYPNGAPGEPIGYKFNQLLRYVKPFYLVPDNAANNPTNPAQVQMAANSWSPQIPMSIGSDGPFEGSMLMYDRGSDDVGACLVELVDMEAGFRITGRPCHVDTILGDGTNPSLLPESIWLNRRQTLQFRAFDLTGDENAIRPIIHGQRLWLDQARDADLTRYAEERMFRRRSVYPYVCPTDEDITLTGAAAATDHYFTQAAIGHFEVFKILYVSTDEFRFKIQDEGGRALTEDWVHAYGGMGTARFPFMTYGTWLIEASGKVTFTLQDLSGQDNTIYLTLMGRMLLV